MRAAGTSCEGLPGQENPGDSERKRRWLQTLGNEVFELLYWAFICDYRIGKERKERKTEEGKGEATTYEVTNQKKGHIFFDDGAATRKEED